MVKEIEEETAERHRRQGTQPKGRKEVLRHHPHHRPDHLEKSPAPAFHAATKAAFEELRNAYNWFVAAYREAADRLRAGDRNVSFPEGSFPPRLPFVRPVESFAPG